MSFFHLLFLTAVIVVDVLAIVKSLSDKKEQEVLWNFTLGP